MPPAPLPIGEADRIAALRSYEILDTEAETVFDNLVSFASKLTKAPIALVSLVDSERQWFKARTGLDAAETPRELSFCAHAILDPSQPLVVEDAERDPRFSDNPLVLGEAGIRFYAGVPLVNPQGHALGTLCIADRQARVLEEDQREALLRLAETVSTALELRRAMNQARLLAMTDGLTGIGNRPFLLDSLDRALGRLRRHGESFALLYVDLDGFKRVNDVQGHLIGDHVLREVAATLRACLRAEDVAARIGGDEFAILLSGPDLHADLAAERIRGEVKARMDEKRWPVTVSVGAVTFHECPDDLEEAMAAADELMYEAKFAGKNCVSHSAYRRAAVPPVAA
ncbi:sensor domain-containing diguanylate cyclase [Roseomonas sp. SSH11]|uniref:Sensor domain-containing diguanylate cyclase n=1 Tax=Pararoseomonas baculiformis TaxID=2820812 RepID=A0ABS4AJ67_9PROT|nr:sensor domain-containing diguanylate cyclase [Pararoseomonas baculiformis]MBP0447077.1 sensor domain-containing diguanylate cyclase [Pararoseomonas baculiformis]